MRYQQRVHRHKPWFFAVCAAALVCAVIFNQRIAQSGIAVPFAAIYAALEIPMTAVTRAIGATVIGAVAIPGLGKENAALRAQNAELTVQLAQTREAVATAPRDRAVELLAREYSNSIVADCVGYDPENTRRTITIDQGSLAGVTRDAGVMNTDGVVGRIVSVTPFSSTVLLLDSYVSNIPAIVQQGRYWAIARGSQPHVHLDDVALDAVLKIGELVVTGRGRSFPAGVPIGRIIAISRSDAALTQTAVVEPSVTFSGLERVLVLPHLQP